MMEQNRKFAGVETMPLSEGLTGFPVINVCKLIDALIPNAIQATISGTLTFKQRQAQVLYWCKVNNAHYYAADREDFSVFEAITEARKAGAVAVVVEDLS